MCPARPLRSARRLLRRDSEAEVAGRSPGTIDRPGAIDPLAVGHPCWSATTGFLQIQSAIAKIPGVIRQHRTGLIIGGLKEMKTCRRYDRVQNWRRSAPRPSGGCEAAKPALMW